MNNYQNLEILYTPFGETLDKKCPLKEYPRPQLKRDSFINLNGYWEYAILNKNQKLTSFQGKILVPFSPESPLSEVNKLVMPSDILYYKRDFEISSDFLKDKTLLNFGAVDYECSVYLNDNLVGSHKGGYFPFSLDVTSSIKTGTNTLQLSVTDPSDKGFQARGKQKIKRGGIFYTPQSGIWQTVWLESVPSNYIDSIKVTPNIDNSEVSIIINAQDNKNATISVLFKGKLIASSKANELGEALIKIPNQKLWSPETPFLYDLVIELGTDKVESYFGMRKYGIIKDEKGIKRLALNNKPYFHNGLLDQGYWPDGLYTPPSEEAIIYDIKTMKDLGFNMLRKHIKIEPMRWYYHCDKIGMLVWQDFINGGKDANKLFNGFMGLFNLNGKDTNYRIGGRQDKEGREEYYVDAKRTMELLHNVVSLALWVPFNESWGQFDALKVYDFVKSIDDTRPIDHASGWIDQGGNDFKSMHIYFVPIKLPKNEDRCVILSEFGGYSLKVYGHVFNKVKAFGYRKFNTSDDLDAAFHKLYNESIIPLISDGLSATVYTQVSDVEDEINGLLTYDRKVLKLNPVTLIELNRKVRL